MEGSQPKDKKVRYRLFLNIERHGGLDCSKSWVDIAAECNKDGFYDDKAQLDEWSRFVSHLKAYKRSTYLKKLISDGVEPCAATHEAVEKEKNKGKGPGTPADNAVELAAAVAKADENEKEAAEEYDIIDDDDNDPDYVDEGNNDDLEEVSTTGLEAALENLKIASPPAAKTQANRKPLAKKKPPPPAKQTRAAPPPPLAKQRSSALVSSKAKQASGAASTASKKKHSSTNSAASSKNKKKVSSSGCEDLFLIVTHRFCLCVCRKISTLCLRLSALLFQTATTS